jgi:hypothetical protein
VKYLLDLDSLEYFYPSMPNPDLIYPCEILTHSGTDPHTMSILFPKDDFDQVLKVGTQRTASAKTASRAASNDLTGLQNLTVPCRIYGSPKHPKNGKYYLLGMRTETNRRGAPTTRIIGGFGSFMGPGMSHSHVVANTCLALDDLKFPDQYNYRARSVWGPADSTGKAIPSGDEQPFWPIGKVELLFRTSSPPTHCASLTPFLSEKREKVVDKRRAKLSARRVT